jgi:hypothetical protein
MARYYFDVVCGDGPTCDDRGHECSGLEKAQADAMRAAGELASEQLRKGEFQDVRVDVRDEQRRPVLSVTVSTRVDRMNITPEAR